MIRAYQEQALREIVEEFKQNRRAVLLNMPTGCGKTVTFAEASRRHIVKVPNAKVLVTVHREEIVGQIYDTLERMGLACGVIQATPCRPVNPHRPVQVASIQTLLARNIQIPDVTLCIQDECHHTPSASWREVPLYYKRRGVFLIGATATPIRGDGLGLGDVYDAIVTPITTRSAIDRGYLVPFELIRPDKPLRTGQIAQSPADAYKAHATGRKAVVFSGNIKAGEQHLREFHELGICSGMVTGDMDAGERRRTLGAYARGEIQVLVNVGVLTEGWDDPPTSCVILARSVGSLSLYIQICGRSLRPSLQTGKFNAVIIDLHGSSYAHGPPDEEHEWQLQGEAVIKKAKVRLDFRFCPFCQVLLEDDATVCPECGTPRPTPTAPEVVGARLVKFARKREESTEERAAYLVRLILEGQTKGYKPGWAYNKYRIVYGEYPPRDITAAAETHLTLG